MHSIFFYRQSLIYSVSRDDDDDDDDASSAGPAGINRAVKADDDSSSSSDDNDSTAAAHAAAIGHSPQPIPTTHRGGDTTVRAAQVPVSAEVSASTIAEADPKAHESPSAEATEDPATTKNNVRVDNGEPAPFPLDNGEPVVTTEATKTEEAPTLMDVDSPDLAPGKDAGNGALDNMPKTEARYMVPFGVNLNERDDDENTPLHVAIHSRKLEHVKLLLEAGASFRMRCDGSWPIHTAISLGALRQHRQFAYECVVVLAEAGADLTAKDDSNHTPLFLACMVNLPQIVSYILSDVDGASTLNVRADRVGNRPLHAAAKFDTTSNPSFSRTAAANATGQIRVKYHPDGTTSTVKQISGFPGKRAASQARVPATSSVVAAPAPAEPTEALLTQLLLGTPGIEVDGGNALGQTPLHIACVRGNWPVVRLLLQAGANPQNADKRGFTPGQLAHKRGMPIPNDLMPTLGDAPESGIVPPPRDLIVDPDNSTLVISHELCLLHRTCPPMIRDGSDPPPENVRRLHVLVDQHEGILRGGEFANCSWKDEARRAAIGDVLKVHDYQYVERISQVIAEIPDHPSAISHLDPDTAISHWTFEAAMRAAGSVCQAVDQVIAGDNRNAFCAVRPPGHHAGPTGIVKCANDPEGGSHGFCLLNNVAIGAAYARSMYRHEGIQKVAIVDFDVHHGNGTEEIIRNLVPLTEKATIRTPFAVGELSSSTYRPWLDETDIHNVFFSSTHGYGHRGFEQPGWFYPASGKSGVSESITNPAMVEKPNVQEFLFSQTWARMGEESRANCCMIINCGLELPEPDGDPQGRGIKQRLELRDTYRQKIFPHLREFDPDLIFISAGFDAHRKDTMNFGYVGMVEEDYEWVTEQLVKIANTCCNGRVVSVLEGGYKIHGGIVSPFARSVASHVRALADGGRSRELYDTKDAEWESQYERHVYEKRERKKEEERERLRLMQLATQSSLLEQIAGQSSLVEQMTSKGGVPEDPDAPSRKRRRNHVDYQELLRQMEQEGFANG